MTLSTSDNKPLDLEKWKRVYLYVSVGTLIFSMIYECFSHDVFSPYMVFAVAFPLLGGLLAGELLKKVPPKHLPGPLSAEIYHCGIATLTVGSIIQGVLEIYGTANPLVLGYLAAGAGLVILSLILWLAPFLKKDKEEKFFW